ncbi:uncharacterized protein LOC134763081 [Penaeus indicus]|uniref:uncharacterized protein LOC134763081 n=1 Tax=Penaeus indicus TaxID=29960 RepID=UPI00300CD62A
MVPQPFMHLRLPRQPSEERGVLACLALVKSTRLREMAGKADAGAKDRRLCMAFYVGHRAMVIPELAAGDGMLIKIVAVSHPFLTHFLIFKAPSASRLQRKRINLTDSLCSSSGAGVPLPGERPAGGEDAVGRHQGGAPRPPLMGGPGRGDGQPGPAGRLEQVPGHRHRDRGQGADPALHLHPLLLRVTRPRARASCLLLVPVALGHLGTGCSWLALLGRRRGPPPPLCSRPLAPVLRFPSSSSSSSSSFSLSSCSLCSYCITSSYCLVPSSLFRRSPSAHDSRPVCSPALYCTL